MLAIKHQPAPALTGDRANQTRPNKYTTIKTGSHYGAVADRILSRLDGVKQTGADTYLANCPSHQDRHPSLSVKDTGDKVLIKCWAGCSAHDIVSSVGLELSDLFPPRSSESSKPSSRPFPAADILRALASDITFIAICANDIAKGEKLTPQEVRKIFEVGGRFRAALVAGGISV